MIFFKNTALAKYEKLFYDFEINDVSGKSLNLNIFKNKIILLVNTASYCGFTKQYDDLQKVWDKYKNNDLTYLDDLKKHLYYEHLLHSKSSKKYEKIISVMTSSSKDLILKRDLEKALK